MEEYRPYNSYNKDIPQQEKMPRKNNFTPIYLIIAFLLGVMLTLYILPNNSRKNVPVKQMQKFNEVFYYVDQYYVDTVNDSKLLEEAISSMLQSLDPHSTYSNPEENKAMNESLEGAFEGIGVQFSILHDTVMVVAVITGGPSEKVGIRVGDRIVTVDGENFAGIGVENADVMKKLRGKKNSEVMVGIKRQGFDQIYDYTITRDVIPTYTVDVAYMIDDKDGYIKVNQFGGTTAREFSDALVKLKRQGMQNLILDLRGNPGGYLDAAIKMCDELLPQGEMIVYTEGRKMKADYVYATRYGNFEQGKVAVLIDDFSASASEIVAGAVQDNDRGIIVGRRSFGKGLVQRQFDLSDKSSIRLTISRYYTPSGRSIQKDYTDGTEAYAEELFHRYENGEMDSASSIKFDETLKYTTKSGKTVYGGGGIMPDYFVPLDRDSNLSAFYQVLNSSAIIEYAFDYCDKKQDQLMKQYPNAKSYVSNMTVDDNMYNELIQYYKKENPQKALPMNAVSKEEIKLWLKALIGRNLYQEEAFYPLINTTDKVILKAIEEIGQ